LPDKDRPLNDRGRRDAPKMGERLAKRDVKPDLILSSPAMRALKTAEIIAKKPTTGARISWWMIGCMPSRRMTCSTSFTSLTTS
jgi:phosphohistidine phosphatase SixA